MEERPYQQEAIEAVFSAHARGVSKTLVVLATGLGKTYVAGKIIDQLPSRLNCAGRVLWLTHEESLIEQSALSVAKTLYPAHAENFDKILKQPQFQESIIKFMYAKTDMFSVAPELSESYHILRNQIGIVKEALFGVQARLVVASVQTLRNRLDRIDPEWFDMIVCDEAHLFVSATFSSTLNYFRPKLRTGLTATPERLDGVSLGNLFDEIVIEKDIKFGIDNNYLCELIAVRVATTLNLDSMRKTGPDFNQKDLKVIDSPVNNIKMVNKWLEEANGRPTIAFCVDVEHTMNLAEHFERKGVKATFIVSDENLCPNRSQRTRDFVAGKYDVACVVKLLTVGFDYPDIGCIIEMAPTMSLTKYMQGVGRGTRNKSKAFIQRFGANNCIIIDLTDNSTRHNVINTWTLDHGKRFEDKVFISKEEKARLIAERNMRELKHKQEKDERVNLLTLPKVDLRLNDPDMQRPASAAQLAWLARENYDIESYEYTMGMVAQIISNWQAPTKDIEYLALHGYDVTGGCTRAQAQAAKKEVAGRTGRKKFETIAGRKLPFSGLT